MGLDSLNRLIGETNQDNAIVNLTRDSAKGSYVYNARGRLAELDIGSTATADYAYDGLERLAIRTTQNMMPSGTTQYVYDLAGHLLAESDGSGTTLTEYVWLDDMPLAVVANVNTGPNLYFVHVDHLNRPIMMTDVNKTLVWRADYNPFGDTYSIGGLATNNLRFPGQYFLLEDGLHYNWYRHYDPTIGRYIQPDPLRDVMATVSATSNTGTNAEERSAGLSSIQMPDFPGGKSPGAEFGAAPLEFSEGPSIYAYAQSTPTMRIDPRGMSSTGPITPIPRQSSTRMCGTVIFVCRLESQLANECIYWCENAGVMFARQRNLGLACPSLIVELAGL